MLWFDRRLYLLHRDSLSCFSFSFASPCRRLFVPVSQVTVLEARNRVGGRMWSRTTTVNGTLLRGEMGAQWIQSATGGNPITALAKQMKLPIGEMNSNSQQYTASGKAYSESQTSKAYAAYEGLVQRAIKYAYSLDKDISLDQAFRAVDKKLYLTPYVQVGGLKMLTWY